MSHYSRDKIDAFLKEMKQVNEDTFAKRIIFENSQNDQQTTIDRIFTKFEHLDEQILTD